MAALAQPAPAPSFEVASVKIAASRENSIEFGPNSLTMRGVRLNAVIAWAFDIREYQVAGPGWVPESVFDIVAKSAGPASEAQLRQMLQSLLADRFQLTYHRETREIPALILVVSPKGLKITPADKPGNPAFRTGKLMLAGDGATIDDLARFLAHELHEAVIDRTGLTGLFHYALDINAYVTEEMRKSDGPPMEANAIITAALQEQLGLKVEARKAPVPMVVIDRLEKSPSEN
jgi:uncharacterized protein (TIGR03435 family)